MTPLIAQLAAESSDAVWRLETNWRYAPWVTVVAVAAMAALVVYCYSRELTPAGRTYRGLPAGLRLITIALLLAMLSEFLLAGTRSGRPTFAVLLDRSPSMGVADADPDSVAAPRSRFKQGVAALTEDEARLLGQLGEAYDLRLFAAADEAEPLEQGEDGWAAVLAELAPDEQAAATRVGDAIEGVLAGSAGPAPQGVLVLTDGRVTAGRPLSAAAESARRASTPLFFLGLGSQDAPPDVALVDPLAEEVVFVDDLVSFRATVRTTSSVKGPVRVFLRREGSPEVLAEAVVEPSAEGGATPVQLIHRPEEPGAFRYVLEAEAAGGLAEELNPANNSAAHELTVRDQQVRVLLASGGPSYEFRYLKHLLERDSTVQLASFLQEADLEYAAADPSAITRLPIRSVELDEYDVVMLMDVDPRLTPRSFWPELKKFVSDSGGGLCLVAGPRHLPGAYRGLNEFAALYPADLQSAGVGEAVTDTGYRVAPTPLGLGRAALQLADDTPGTTLVWGRLPELYWYAELGELKPAAQVLAMHPSAMGADGGPAPLIVSQYFGAGQVIVHATDSTYRWRRRRGDVYFARYWVQTLRALARGRLAGAEGGAALTVDRRRYEPGEPVRLRLRAPSAGDAPAVLIEPESGQQLRAPLAASPDARGVYEATLDRLPVGRYRAVLAEGPADGAPAATTFEVVAPPGEFARLEMAAEEMRAAATRSRGGFYTLENFDDFATDLPTPRRVPIESLPPVELWNQWWMLAGVCGCLTLEWILRKRRAML